MAPLKHPAARLDFLNVAWALFFGAITWFLVASVVGGVVTTFSPPINPHAAPAWLPTHILGLHITFGV
jgi:hypothetical protein